MTFVFPLILFITEEVSNEIIIIEKLLFSLRVEKREKRYK